jgi:hypothetical protein
VLEAGCGASPSGFAAGAGALLPSAGSLAAAAVALLMNVARASALTSAGSGARCWLGSMFRASTLTADIEGSLATRVRPSRAGRPGGAKSAIGAVGTERLALTPGYAPLLTGGAVPV